jgi:hypothetical protein
VQVIAVRFALLCLTLTILVLATAVFVLTLTFFVCLLSYHNRSRQKGSQCCAGSHWPCARPSTPVRCGEGLVQIEVHDVKTQLAGFDDTHDSVQVGPVTIEQSTTSVDEPGNLQYVLVE